MTDNDQAGPGEERLEELDDDIARTREKAEDAGIIDDPDELRYHETGEKSDIDDQMIVPPG